MAQTSITSFFAGDQSSQNITIKQEPIDSKSEIVSTLVSVKCEPKKIIDYPIQGKQEIEPKTEVDVCASDYETDEEDDGDQYLKFEGVKTEPTVGGEQSLDDKSALRCADQMLSNGTNSIASIFARLNPPDLVSHASNETQKRKNEHFDEATGTIKKIKLKKCESFVEENLCAAVERDIEQSIKKSASDEKIQKLVDRAVAGSKYLSRFCVDIPNREEVELKDMVELRELVSAHIEEEERAEKKVLNQIGDNFKSLVSAASANREEKLKLLQRINALEQKQSKRLAAKMCIDFEKKEVEIREQASEFLKKELAGFDFNKWDNLVEGDETTQKAPSTTSAFSDIKYSDFYAVGMHNLDSKPKLENQTQRVMKGIVTRHNDVEIPEQYRKPIDNEINLIRALVSNSLQPHLERRSINSKQFMSISERVTQHFQADGNYSKAYIDTIESQMF